MIPAFQEVALATQIQAGNIVSALVLDIVAAAAHVGGFERRRPRQFDLKTEGELIHRRRFEIWIKPGKITTHERGRIAARAGWRQDAVRIGVG